MRAPPIGKNSEQLLAAMIRNLRDEYSVLRAFFQLKISVTRKDEETAVRDPYAGRRIKKIVQSFPTTALPALFGDPHAFFLGGPGFSGSSSIGEGHDGRGRGRCRRDGL